MKYVHILEKNKKYFEDFITRSTYHTNAIEGSTLTYANTYAILFNDNSFLVNAKPREIYEAINHKYAINLLLDNIKKGFDLDEGIIIELAKQINKNISEISGYRKVQVFIQGSDYIPPSPIEVRQKMMYLLDNYRHNSENLFNKVADLHIQFEKIHPFGDGNGRTGRLIINHELLKNDHAPVVIPSEERSCYFEMIRNHDVKALAEYLKVLSDNERKRILIFEQKLNLEQTNENGIEHS